MMGDRDLLLVLNIVDYLLETSEGKETAQEFREIVADSLGDSDKGDPKSEVSQVETATLEDSSHKTVEGSLSIEEEIKQLRARNSVLEERVASQQQMTQMTVESIMSQVKELEESNVSLAKYEKDYKAQSERLFEQTSSQLDMMQMTIEYLTAQIKAFEIEKRDLVEYEAQYKKQGETMMEQVDSQLSMMQMTIEYLTAQIKALEVEKDDLAKYEAQYKKQGKIMMEQADSQLGMMQMTIEYLTSQVKNLEVANDSLETSRTYAKRQEEILIEQVSSQLEMFQMTHEYHMEQQNMLKEEIGQHKLQSTNRIQLFQSLSRNLLTSYFDAEAKLNSMFSNVLHYPASSEGSQKSFVCVIEKFGIIYLVLIKTEIDEDLADLFQLISNFALSNVIGIKKYVNPSRIIEEYLTYMNSIQNGSDSLNTEELELGVCLIDNINLEVEFASTGLSVYSAFNTSIEEHESSATLHAAVGEGIGRRASKENQYRIRKLGFRKGGGMFLSSCSPSEEFTQEGVESSIKVKDVVQQVVAKGFPDRQNYINEFVETHNNSKGELAKENFFLLGITF